jgi:hypothetical protein
MHSTHAIRVIGLVAGAWLVCSAGSTYAATFNQNLGMSTDGPQLAEALLEPGGSGASRSVLAPPVVADPAPVAKPQARPARTQAPARPAAAPPAPTGAEIVGKLLSPGASDPNVPLPRADLAETPSGNAASGGPQLFGRADTGDGLLDLRGGVLGLRVPIPADRNASGANTRSSPGVPDLQMGSGTR